MSVAAFAIAGSRRTMKPSGLVRCRKFAVIFRVASIAAVFYVAFFLLGTESTANDHVSLASFRRSDGVRTTRRRLTSIPVDEDLQTSKRWLTSSEEAPVQLRLMHRNSPKSPLRHVHRSRLEALMEAKSMDVARIHGFHVRLQSSFSASQATSGAHHHHRPPGKGGSSQSAWKHAARSFRTLVKSGAAAGTGQYLVDFHIGTPAQKLLLIVDTGSDLLWVRCSECAKCSSEQGESVYAPRTSSTFWPMPCHSNECLLVPPPPTFTCDSGIPSTCRYDYIYADLSESSGVLAVETVTLNASSGGISRIPNVAFGCGLTNSGKSFVGSGGVMGLGRGSISFPSQIGSSIGNTFSYCLVDFFRTPPEDSFLFFGSATASSMKLQAPLQFTPFLTNPFGQSFYYVGIREVRVDGEQLAIPSSLWEIDPAGNGGTVIDSGTTLTFFVEPAYQTILQAISNALVYPRVNPLQTFDLCFNASGISSLKLPELSITFQGNAVFQPSPINYFIDVADGVKCLGFQGVDTAVAFSVLGNLIQQNFIFEYDRQKAQLGFAPTLCSAAL